MLFDFLKKKFKVEVSACRQEIVSFFAIAPERTRLAWVRRVIGAVSPFVAEIQ